MAYKGFTPTHPGEVINDILNERRPLSASVALYTT